MKKLLSSLGSIILVGTAASGVTACGTKEKNNQHKNANGDSIWAWIPGIFGGKEITSPDIWSVLENPFIDAGNGKWTNDPNEWDGPTKIKMSVQLMQILSVAILAHPDKFFEDKENKKKQTDIADYKDLEEIFKSQWNLLVKSTNNTIEKKKESFKDSDKKNWEKKYHEFLDSNYKDISGASGDEKYRIEEQNYKAAIMTTGADGGTSATQILNNILLNNNMRVYEKNTAGSSSTILNDFATFLQKDGNQVKDWNSNNQNARTQLALTFTWNKDTTSFDIDFSKLTIAEIDTRLEKTALDLKALKYDTTQYLLAHSPVDTPVFNNSSATSIGTPKLMNTYDAAQMSLFQKFLIEKWFQNEKPLAISKITYAFKSGATPTDTGFTTDSFDETTRMQINNDLTKLATAQSWDDFTNNIEGTVTASTDLLTLSTQADTVKSNILKASVYNSIDNASESSPTDIKDVVTKISRKQPTDPISGNWKIGKSSGDIVVSFFDTNGLNLVHIDGREYLQNADPTSYSSYKTDWQFKSLNYSNNYYSTLQDKSNIMTTDKNKQIMNTQFSNAQYLWYLVNRSLVNSSTNSKLKFKVLDEVKKYATLNSGSGSSDDKTWWWWIFDFFNNLNTNILMNETTAQQWLKDFITFDKNKPNNSEINSEINKNENDADWFISIINAMSTNLAGGTVQQLYSSFETENKTIEGYKVDGPAAKINTKSIVDKINDTKVWHESINTTYSMTTVGAETPSWVHQFAPLTTDSTKYYLNKGGRR